MIKEAENVVAMQVKIQNIKYSSTINEDVPVILNSDPNKIRQVLINLLENAVKYNGSDGSISLIVSKSEKNNSSSIKFEIIDTGKGISKNQTSNIFLLDGNYNQSSLNTRVSISLPVSIELCKLLGGKLTVSSQLGKGSKFTFFLKDIEHNEPKPIMPKLKMLPSMSECDVEEKYHAIPSVHIPFAFNIRKTKNSGGETPNLVTLKERNSISYDIKTEHKRMTSNPSFLCDTPPMATNSQPDMDKKTIGKLFFAKEEAKIYESNGFSEEIKKVEEPPSLSPPVKNNSLEETILRPSSVERNNQDKAFGKFFNRKNYLDSDTGIRRSFNIRPGQKRLRKFPRLACNL